MKKIIMLLIAALLTACTANLPSPTEAPTKTLSNLLETKVTSIELATHAVTSTVNPPTPTSTQSILECGGRNIAFDSNRDSNGEIYAVNFDGTHLRNLTQNPANEYSPFYSPDGKYIVFWSDQDGDAYNQDVFIMNSDGTNIINLTNQSIKLKGGSLIYWSLDGQKISTLHTLSEAVILTISLSKLEVVNTEVVPIPESSDRTFGKNEWYMPTVFLPEYSRSESVSPNGKCVVFANGGQIYIRSQLKGSKAINITNDLSINDSPVWQP